MTTTTTTNTYNYIIVGGGPSALSFAQAVGQAGQSVLILERELVAGGCHRVKRIGTQQLFTEHGPRVYTAAYKTFEAVLKDMGLDFYQMFSSQYVDFFHVGGVNMFTALGMKENWHIMKAFWHLAWDPNYGKNMTMKEFTQGFNSQAIDGIDRLCRFTDGSGIDRYTVNEFLELINQLSIYYKVYVPNQPNDEALFPLWTQFLEKKHGVEFIYGVEVMAINMDTDNNTIALQFTDQSTLHVPNHTKLIFAIPPIHLVKILNNSNYDPFGPEFHRFAENTKYNTYLTVTLEWNITQDFYNLKNFPPSDFGIAFLPLFTSGSSHKRTKILSAGVTILDRKNNRNKTANEYTEDEIKAEVLATLKSAMPNLPDPVTITLNPNQKKGNNDIMWEDSDNGFIGKTFVSFESKENPNIFTLGPHNGHSIFSFTSIESATSNAVTLANKLHPGKITLKPKSPWKLTDFITGWCRGCGKGGHE
jgi:hypothetical protein